MADTISYPLNSHISFFLANRTLVLFGAAMFPASLSAQGGHVTGLSSETSEDCQGGFWKSFALLIKGKRHSPYYSFFPPYFFSALNVDVISGATTANVKL